MDTYNSTLSSYAIFRPYLQDGEELLWTGKPYTSVPFRPDPRGLIFSIFWLGFAIFWTVGASAGGGLFGLFGLPFIGIGLFLFYTQFIGIGKQMEKTHYAVTDRRAIILTETRRGVLCTEYSFFNMGNVMLASVRGNVGTILFPSQPYLNPYASNHGSSARANIQQTMSHGFLMIDNVQMVYRLISERIAQNGYR